MGKPNNWMLKLETLLEGGQGEYFGSLVQVVETVGVQFVNLAIGPLGAFAPPDRRYLVV